MQTHEGFILLTSIGGIELVGRRDPNGALSVLRQARTICEQLHLLDTAEGARLMTKIGDARQMREDMGQHFELYWQARDACTSAGTLARRDKATQLTELLLAD